MKYHIDTYGCQMNKNDSRRIKQLFEQSGFSEASQKEADFIIINACAVRKRVVDKIRAEANQISSNQTSILTGCVLDDEKETLSKKFDYVLDIKSLPQWPQKIEQLKEINKQANYFNIKPKREHPIAYVPIMTGCDNFCSYCAVPYVRGREESRPPQEIIKEVKSLTKKDFKEIWLLGQNVNSYNPKEDINFAELLKKINKIQENFWIKFTSSHPKDLSEQLIKTIKNYAKISNYLNLPLQSGDDQILENMNRPYTSKEYKKLVAKVRSYIPQITLSTDVIVGFPGEDKKAFNNTKNLLEEIKFDMAYIARYSPRPQTKAAELEDDVPDKVKKQRAKELTEVLKKEAKEKNKKRVGETVEFLPTTTKDEFLIGKTKKHKSIKVEGHEEQLNSFQTAKITGATSFGLKGKII